MNSSDEEKNIVTQLKAELAEKTKWAFALTDAVEAQKETGDKLIFELEERTKWAQGLDQTVEEKNKLIKDLQKESQERTEWAQKIDKELTRERKEIQTLKSSLQEKEDSIQKLQANLQEREDSIQKLQANLQEREDSIQKLQANLQEREDSIQKLQANLQEREDSIQKLQANLQEREDSIQKLQANLQEKEDSIQKLQANLQEREDSIQKLQANLQEREDSIQKLQASLQEKEDFINRLNFIIQDHENTINIILNSRSYKLGYLLIQPLRILIPPRSKRRLLCKMFLGALRNPIKFFKTLRLKNIKKFLSASKKDGYDILIKKFDDHLNQRNLSAKKSGATPESISLFDDNLDTTKTIKFKKHKNPLVSIIIPVYNAWDYNYRCLLSIFENTHPDISYEIIIADDCSSDTTKDIKKHIKNIKVARPEENLGFLKNCNNAAKQAVGKYVFFLNNDTQVQKNWLKSLVDLIESDKSIGMVGSKLVYPDGRLQEAGGIIWQDASGWNYGRLNDPSNPEYNYLKEADYISGAAIMLSKKLWDEIGGFDERYVPAYFEDSDLAFEVRKHDFKVVYQPQSVVVHFEGISHGTDENSGLKKYQAINKEKFIEKWRETLEKEHFENGQDVFWARDKTKDKKTILIIDHYVPHFDKDAGSRTIYQYIELFVKLGYNVKFLGDNFYKHEPYTELLQQMGVEVLYGVWYLKHWQDWIKENSAQLDFVYLHRGHIASKYVDFIKENTAAKIVYNAVDFSFLRELRQYAITKDPQYLRQANQSKTREMNIFNLSDVIITISEHEKAVLKQQLPHKQITVIPTFIYDEEFPLSKNNNFNSRTDITFVGGFKHEPNEDGILWFLEKIYPILQKTIPKTRINIIGSGPTEKILKFQSDLINVTGFVSDEELKEYYSKTRVIIAPLRFGAGVKGKIIEAIAEGIPTVTTVVGAEGIPESKNILKITNSEEKFASKILSIYQDKKTWEQIRNDEINYSNKLLSASYAQKIIKKIF